jgi:hypothetical protein
MEKKLGLILIILALLSFSMTALACAPKEDTSHAAIKQWVIKEYGPSAKAEISGELHTSLPEVTTYRGGIILPNERKEGMFFYNSETGLVYFLSGMDIPIPIEDEEQ